MEIVLVVLNNSIIKTIRSPSLSVERNGDGLTETVQLETGAADGIHDGSVVDDLNGNLALLGTNDKISMSCSSRNSKKARSMQNTRMGRQQPRRRCSASQQSPESSQR